MSVLGMGTVLGSFKLDEKHIATIGLKGVWNSCLHVCFEACTLTGSRTRPFSIAKCSDSAAVACKGSLIVVVFSTFFCILRCFHPQQKGRMLWSITLVDSLGFSKQQALSCSSKLIGNRLCRGRVANEANGLGYIPKADSIISFLKQSGFHQSHIQHIVFYNPRILRFKIDKTLKPKIEFLRELGLSGPGLIQFVTENPEVFHRGLNSCILPPTQALRQVLGIDGNSIALFKRLSGTVINDLAKNLVPNVTLLRNYGIPLDSIRKRIIHQPSPYIGKPKSFEDLLIKVEKKWGIPRDSPVFLYGVHLVGSLSDEVMESKCQVFKNFGWTESDIREIVRRIPNCLTSSEARIKKSLEFFRNELGYKPAVIASHPALLISSLEKRIIPRHKVLLVLKEKALITRDYPLYNAVNLSETSFVKRFVLPFKEVHDVYAECTGHSVQLLTQGKGDGYS
ncbi:hypothetical protein Cgig2_012080 [Carnegiea gigantea]|uniref:Mitochondrial transcription termination factor n=1 Tax=Carnegiea gigantea TaxID=171969 RepID=A0A9Q1JJC6_9CARY|nr:hypothetical protein Cgig2_012080 [Carnegiea gigantea]